MKTGAIADRLMETAYRHGVPSPGIIVDEVRGDGTILKKSCRAWPLTEAAKAQAVRMEYGDPLAADRLADALDWPAGTATCRASCPAYGWIISVRTENCCRIMCRPARSIIWR